MHRLPDIFEVKPPVERPKSAWIIPEPVIDNAEQKKQLFGIELAKNSAFQAACEVFGEDTNTALWVSQNWVNDPIVIAAKDKYLEAADVSQALLDKEQFARKLLNMAEEKNASRTLYLLDGANRLKALELFAKVMGYSDTKDKSQFNPTFINSMTVKFVEPEIKEQKIKQIDHNTEIENPNSSPIKLKLVG